MKTNQNMSLVSIQVGFPKGSNGPEIGRDFLYWCPGGIIELTPVSVKRTSETTFEVGVILTESERAMVFQ